MDILSIAFGEQGEVQIEWAEEIEQMFFRHAVVLPPGQPDDFAEIEELIEGIKSDAEQLLTYVHRDASAAEIHPYDNPIDVERRGEG